MKKKRKNKPKRSTAQLTKNLIRVRQLYAMGKNIQEIADDVGIMWATARADVDKVLEQWRQQNPDLAFIMFNEILTREQLLVRESWIAWEGSKEGNRKVTIKKFKDENGDVTRTEETVSREETQGEARHLQQISQSNMNIAKLMGLIKDTKEGDQTINIHQEINHQFVSYDNPEFANSNKFLRSLAASFSKTDGSSGPGK